MKSLPAPISCTKTGRGVCCLPHLVQPKDQDLQGQDFMFLKDPWWFTWLGWVGKLQGQRCFSRLERSCLGGEIRFLGVHVGPFFSVGTENANYFYMEMKLQEKLVLCVSEPLG